MVAWLNAFFVVCNQRLSHPLRLLNIALAYHFDSAQSFRVSFRMWLCKCCLLKMTNKLNVVHIGKCGGGTVTLAIRQSTLLSERFNIIEITHINKVKYSDKDSYLIVIRNPIDRAISAFNWRYHLVVETEAQSKRFKGEWEILKKYSTLNSISEKIYDPKSGLLNERVSREFKTIHHLRENISFYLSSMLKYLRPMQVYGIIKQHSLSEDCKLLLGPNVNILHDKNHGLTVDPVKKQLSELARINLRRFLHKDFVCILKLYNMGLMSWKDYELLTRWLRFLFLC